MFDILRLIEFCCLVTVRVSKNAFYYVCVKISSNHVYITKVHSESVTDVKTALCDLSWLMCCFSWLR